MRSLLIIGLLLLASDAQAECTNRILKSISRDGRMAFTEDGGTYLMDPKKVGESAADFAAPGDIITTCNNNSMSVDKYLTDEDDDNEKATTDDRDTQRLPSMGEEDKEDQ